MAGWQELYESGEFSIATDQPSDLVVEYEGQIAPGLVADVGCGNGRNAVYMARHGFEVHASDVVDLGWVASLPEELRHLVRFTLGSTSEIEMAPDTYSGVMLMRLFQYLSPGELEDLIAKVSVGLKAGGIALASFATTGVHPVVADAVDVYNHDPGYVVRGFKEHGVEEVTRRDYSRVASKHVPFKSVIDVCELVVRKT